MTDTELEALSSQSPIHRDERTWLSVKDYLFRRLHELVPGDIELGSYWIGNHYDNGGSFCCRIRSGVGLPFLPESDAWEGSFCTSGDKERSWTDINAFPFRRGRVVRPGGTYWGLHFSASKWQSRGWLNPDGPGEWEWVKRTGDCYTAFRSRSEIVRQPLRSRPPVVTIQPEIEFDDRWEVGAIRTARVGLHTVRRTGELGDLSGETISELWDLSRTLSVPVFPSPRVVSSEFDLGHLPIRGGWVSGEYKVALRSRYEPHRIDGPQSFVTTPITFTIR